MFESAKKFENGGVWLNSGGGAASLGWPATAPERCLFAGEDESSSSTYLFSEMFC